MNGEIWFEKVLWSYMPCHWKGWAALVGIIVFTVTMILLGQMTFDALHWSNLDWLPFPLFFFPAWLWLLTIAKRHS